MPAVVAEDLRKRFGSNEALRGVDLVVEAGTVLGLLGPNGAGKTTTVRILTTLLRPDGGRATIEGLDVVADARRVRARIGLTGQYAAVDERLTARENLQHVGRLFHLGVPEARRRGDELLGRFDLEDAADRPVGGFSGGMRRRLDIAMSLISRPAVLFLDEPTTGLDPRSRLAMWDLIDELVAEGTTTVLTTQYLDEAERLADDIVVIDRGTVIARGTADELKRDIGGARIEVTTDARADLGQVVTLLEGLEGLGGGARTDRDRHTVTVRVQEAHGIVPAVVRLLDDHQIEVLDVVVRQPTLDDVFLQLTGHHADADADADAEPATTGPTATGGRP